MNKTLKKILTRIIPTKEEQELEKKLIEELISRLKKKGVKPLLVGSLAKDTDIRGTKDIDMFILFPQDVKREDLKTRGLEIGKELFDEMNLRYEIDYAEHPYVIGHFNEEYTIEIVPCYDIKNPKIFNISRISNSHHTPKKKSAVDRTPYHTKYVRGKLRKNPAEKGEIRLLKTFMKGADVYGAEAKIRGFSGYLAELLVINYGSFEKVIRAASKWRFGTCIDPENLWEDKKLLKYFFTDSDLVVVDPTDKNRNVAAALSRQTLSEFIVACRNFIENPGEEFFFPKVEKVPGKQGIIDKFMMRGTKLIALAFSHERINPNTLYSQLRKTEESIKTQIQDYNFKILKSGFWTDEVNKSVILYEFDVWKLPNVVRRFGPRIDMDIENQENFISKYESKKPYVENGKWVVDAERKFTDVIEVVELIVEGKMGFGKDVKEFKVDILVDEGVFESEGEGGLRFLGRFF